MRHFYRSQLPPAEVLKHADEFFPGIGLVQVLTAARARTFSGALGTLKLHVKAEAETDQMGESRMDRNVKRFFVELHRHDDPAHKLEASY
jgi:hypothetical protein